MGHDSFYANKDNNQTYPFRLRKNDLQTHHDAVALAQLNIALERKLAERKWLDIVAYNLVAASASMNQLTFASASR